MADYDYYLETESSYKQRIQRYKRFGDWIQEKQERNQRLVLVENIELVEQEYIKKKTNEGFLFHIHCPLPYVPNDRPVADLSSHYEHHSLAESRHERYTDKEKIFPHFSIEYYLNTKGNLLPWHEVKAINGIVWKYDEAYLTQNKDICSYVRGGSSMWGSSRTDYAIPTRGNCLKCGANGALGQRCHNMCTEIGIEYTSDDSRSEHFLKWSRKQCEDEGEKVSRTGCIFQLMKTPDNKGIIDAKFYSEACFVNSKSKIDRLILSYVGYEARGRVSPRLQRSYCMPYRLKHFLEREEHVCSLKTDDENWKKVFKLCGKKGYGHPTKLKAGAMHFPDWSTYKLEVDEHGQPTLQECVGRKRKYVPSTISFSQDRKVQRQQNLFQLGIKVASAVEKTGLEITHCI